MCSSNHHKNKSYEKDQVPAASQLKELSTNKELEKQFDPTSAYYADQLLQISDDYHEKEQNAGN